MYSNKYDIMKSDEVQYAEFREFADILDKEFKRILGVLFYNKTKNIAWFEMSDELKPLDTEYYQNLKIYCKTLPNSIIRHHNCYGGDLNDYVRYFVNEYRFSKVLKM